MVTIPPCSLLTYSHHSGNFQLCEYVGAAMSPLVDRPTQLICIWISICHNEKKPSNLMQCHHQQHWKSRELTWTNLCEKNVTTTSSNVTLQQLFPLENWSRLLERSWRGKFHFSSDFTFEVLFSSVRTFYLEPHLAKRLGAARLLVDHQCLGNFLIH